MSDEPWFAVRCLLRFLEGPGAENGPLYEERITLWRSSCFDDATERAQAEAIEYASVVGGSVVEMAQAFHLSAGEVIDDGAELFSLMRNSELPPDEYVDRFFVTGRERQGTAGDHSRAERLP